MVSPDVARARPGSMPWLMLQPHRAARANADRAALSRYGPSVRQDRKLSRRPARVESCAGFRREAVPLLRAKGLTVGCIVLTRYLTSWTKHCILCHRRVGIRISQ